MSAIGLLVISGYLASVVLWLLSRRHATRAEYAAEHAEEAARVAVRAAQFAGNVNAVWKG